MALRVSLSLSGIHFAHLIYYYFLSTFKGIIKENAVNDDPTGGVYHYNIRKWVALLHIYIYTLHKVFWNGFRILSHAVRLNLSLLVE